jgi:hypothetical protein
MTKSLRIFRRSITDLVADSEVTKAELPSTTRPDDSAEGATDEGATVVGAMFASVSAAAPMMQTTGRTMAGEAGTSRKVLTMLI